MNYEYACGAAVATTDSALTMAEGEWLTVMEADQGNGWTPHEYVSAVNMHEL